MSEYYLNNLMRHWFFQLVGVFPSYLGEKQANCLNTTSNHFRLLMPLFSKNQFTDFFLPVPIEARDSVNIIKMSVLFFLQHLSQKFLGAVPVAHTERFIIPLFRRPVAHLPSGACKSCEPCWALVLLQGSASKGRYFV